MTLVRDLSCEIPDRRFERLEPSLVGLVCVHRIGTEVGFDGFDVAKFFMTGEGRKYTGGNVPYHYLGLDGEVQQLLPLNEQGAHARLYNLYAFGFAALGDFRKSPPSSGQWAAAVTVCADLVPLLSWTSPGRPGLPSYLQFDVPVVGHGEVPGAFGWKSGKEHPDGRYACPGKHWSMTEFRQDVCREVRLRHEALVELRGHRVV